eukprot:CAMPEP_0197702132 /NCGR_PEP_ID=MMETSP1338-20131121/124126_1 /TAXON_ID=43686 ORGANISM="Pelagodinium beii, Strain RCC1491" /NCGR_SAMPLE_ID=MMETSP1338 /ASSEMBLY_ACC=CAM_ASM_000754 /LENGTH=31 /DNA_ID= /DNA_START= /DNA_END= /DNA_ORIENTATION=
MVVALRGGREPSLGLGGGVGRKETPSAFSWA